MKPADIMKPAEIIALRESLHLSQSDLAIFCERGRPWLNSIESGRVAISRKQLVVLEAAYQRMADRAAAAVREISAHRAANDWKEEQYEKLKNQGHL